MLVLDWNDHIIIARVASLLLAPLEWWLVWIYLNYWDLFRKKSLKRFIAWLVLVLSILPLTLGQMFIYRKIGLGGVGRIHDISFGTLLLFQHAITVFLMFYILIKRRKTDGMPDKK